MPMPLLISPLTTLTSLDSLRGLSSFNYTYSAATLSSLKHHFKLKDSLYLLVTSGTEFAAFCSIDRDWWEPNFFFLREILVSPKFQKLGIGQELMHRCIEHARAKKARGVVTETAFKNYPMQSLCAKFHFQVWDNPKWKEGITYKLEF